MRRVPRLAAAGACVIALAALVAQPPAGAASAHTASADTRYVRAGAPAGGDGSRALPYGSLAAVQAASHAGDAIVVLPSDAALDGGIALKADQTLVGAGPAVTGLTASAQAPRITNTSSAWNSGDAVVLADGAQVVNLVITRAYRGGIYGSNVTNVSVSGNDLSGTNTSCATGFVVQPFSLPTIVRGVGVPFSSGLSNGWAAIMLDADRASESASVVGNVVHDASCADGIDVRASKTANMTAHIEHNTVTRLDEAPSKLSVLAIGVQAIDDARLRAEVTHNTETYIGSATLGDLGVADSEGIFENAAGHADITENVTNNTFAHGLGHLSANCVEEVASNGTPTIAMTLTDSTCDYVVGDVLEAANLASANMTMTIDHVRAAHSTWPLAAVQALALPGDDGDCLMEAVAGSAGSTSVIMRNSEFTDCVGDGLGVVSNVVDGTNRPIGTISFDIADSRIAGNHLSNLRVEGASPIQQLLGTIEYTDLRGSAGTPVLLENPYAVPRSAQSDLDLGGGRLGSAGHNCISGGTVGDVLALNFDLDAQHNWWGQAGGPGFARTIAIGGSITSTPPLLTNTCGPRSATGPRG